MKPLRDWVLIKRTAYKHAVLEVVGIDLNKGQIVAVGPGRRVKRKVKWLSDPDNLDAGYFETETGPERVNKDGSPMVRPMSLKVGDYVEFSPRGQVEVEVDGESFVMVRESSIYWTTNDSQSSAILEQRSAGTRRDGSSIY